MRRIALLALLTALILAGCRDAQPAPAVPGPAEGQPASAPEPPRLEAAAECPGPTNGKPLLPGAQVRLSYLCGQKLWSLDLATGERQLLAGPPGGVASYLWEPRGRAIAYSSARQTSRPEIYILDPGTGSERLLASPNAESARPYGWTVDGAALLIWVYRSTFLVVDPWTGRELGQFGARRLLLSPVSAQLAYRESVDAGLLVEDGGSSSVVVATIAGGKLAKRAIGSGDRQQGFTPWLFAADGTLVYEQYATGDGSPRSQTTIAWWALPPGAAEPVRLTPDSPLAQRGQAEKEKSGKPVVIGGFTTLATLPSPDGKWVLFTAMNGNSPAGTYVTDAALTGEPVALKGLQGVQWEPHR